MKIVLHHILACLGIAAIFLQMNAVALDYALFRMNQNEIAQTECEHKVPHCNGHCYLMKQMARSMDDSSTAANNKKSERQITPLDGHYLSISHRDMMRFAADEQSDVSFYNSQILSGFEASILQPPRTV